MICDGCGQELNENEVEFNRKIGNTEDVGVCTYCFEDGY